MPAVDLAPPAPPPPRRLLLVDDHALVRAGLLGLLQALGTDWSVHEAATPHEALERLRAVPHAVALVDLSMPGMHGLDLTARICAAHPATAVIVLSMHAEEQYAVRALRAGASGYLTKNGSAAQLLAAVGRVAAGGTYVSSDLAEHVVRLLSGRAAAPPHAELTDREFDVLRRIVAGQRLTDIAAALHLSVKTVSTHKTRIQEKLQLPTTAALIRYGVDARLDATDAGPLRRDGTAPC